MQVDINGNMLSTTKWRTNKILWANQLKLLVELCRAKGLSVAFVRGAEDQIDGNTITINCARPKRTQFNLLLHELGHSIVDRTFKYDSRRAHIYARMHDAHSPSSRSTLGKQISLLESEMLAWHYGELAAIENELVIDDKSFNAMKARCLKSYVQANSALYSDPGPTRTKKQRQQQRAK